MQSVPDVGVQVAHGVLMLFSTLTWAAQWIITST
jgi:hypothetical protein